MPDDWLADLKLLRERFRREHQITQATISAMKKRHDAAKRALDLGQLSGAKKIIAQAKYYPRRPIPYDVRKQTAREKSRREELAAREAAASDARRTYGTPGPVLLTGPDSTGLPRRPANSDNVEPSNEQGG